MSPVGVVRVTDEHMETLAGFYRKVWDPDVTPESEARRRKEVAQRNPARPGEPPPTWLVVQDHEAIAHVTTIPIKLWLNGSEGPAYWVKGLWVLPDFQRSSAGFLLLRAVAGMSEPALALVHEPAAIRLFQAVGYTDLGALPNRMRVLRARHVLSRLNIDVGLTAALSPAMRTAARLVRSAAPIVGPLISAANNLWSLIGTGPLRGLTSEVTDTLDRDEVEELWRAVRNEIPAGPSRDAAALMTRYPSQSYAYATVRSNARLMGLGIVKRPSESGDPRLQGMRISSLSDMLFPPSNPRVGLALLRAAEGAARHLQADALLCSASTSAIYSLLRRRGYLRLPENLHVLGRVPASKGPIPAALGDWWVTRGDSEADGAF